MLAHVLYLGVYYDNKKYVGNIVLLIVLYSYVYKLEHVTIYRVFLMFYLLNHFQELEYVMMNEKDQQLVQCDFQICQCMFRHYAHMLI